MPFQISDKCCSKQGLYKENCRNSRIEEENKESFVTSLPFYIIIFLTQMQIDGEHLVLESDKENFFLVSARLSLLILSWWCLLDTNKIKLKVHRKLVLVISKALGNICQMGGTMQMLNLLGSAVHSEVSLFLLLFFFKNVFSVCSV